MSEPLGGRATILHSDSINGIIESNKFVFSRYIRYAPIGSARSSFPVDGASALGFRQAFFEVHQA